MDEFYLKITVFSCSIFSPKAIANNFPGAIYVTFLGSSLAIFVGLSLIKWSFWPNYPKLLSPHEYTFPFSVSTNIDPPFEILKSLIFSFLKDFTLLGVVKFPKTPRPHIKNWLSSESAAEKRPERTSTIFVILSCFS